MKIEGSSLLLVEDEPIIGFALEDMMIAEGAETCFASSLETAEELARTRAFDGAIVDVNLHGQSSYSLARDLLKRGVVLIFATGYGSLAHPEEFARVPTTTKPYDLDAIRRAFEEAA